MSATFFGGEVKYTKRYQLGQLLGDAHAALPADDRDAAQRQGGGLPALHGAARRRPLRGPLPRRRPRGRRLRPDAPAWSRRTAQVRRHAALPRAQRLHRHLQALRRRGRSSTRRSPTTCARSSTAPRRSQNDRRARAPSASPSPSSSAGSPRRPRRSTSRSAAAASGWRSRLREEQLLQRGGRGRARPRAEPARARRRGRRRPRRRARRRGRGRPRRRSSTRRPRPGRSPSSRPRSRILAAAGGAGASRSAQSGTDRKWDELLDAAPGQRREMFDAAGPPPQADHLHRAPRHAELPRRAASRTLLGRPEAVVDDPRRHGPRGAPQGAGVVHAATPRSQVLVATDAAGEGINLQRAHLMVNYDLPWNPNRLEQRFGRIHRIGQTEVCHLWNLVADETREGEVYRGCWRSSRRSARRSAARSSTCSASVVRGARRCATC